MGLSGFIGTNFAQGKPILLLVAPGTPPVDEHEAALIIGFAGSMDEAMTKWFREHSKAVVVTIAHIDTSGTKAAAENDNYVWVVDGDHNLNLELVRQGFIPSNTQTGVNPRDLKIPRADYVAFVQKAWQAGKEAKEKKVGMWMEGLPN
jgi:endonuclease YncB( thermonuclease family)